MLDIVFATIEEATDIIPSRCVLVECNDEIMEQGIYADYGFKYLRKYEGLHQYIMKI